MRGWVPELHLLYAQILCIIIILTSMMQILTDRRRGVSLLIMHHRTGDHDFIYYPTDQRQDRYCNALRSVPIIFKYSEAD